MLHQLKAEEMEGGVNLVDLGASGSLDLKWEPIQQLVNLVGFDPNAEECKRLSELPTELRSARYLPYAVGGEDGDATLYRTKSGACYSLLRPNESWLRRFEFAELFELTGSEPVQTRRFGDITELKDFDVDAIKVDTQGLELPILSNAGALLDRAFYVETETGFVENYLGETTYAQIDEFMRSRGFVMFDINVRHRIARRNAFAQRPTGSEQILWCEAVWLKDYVGLAAQGALPELSRAKALKVLLLCALQDCRDFGYELAESFHERELISSDELSELRRPESWQLTSSTLQQLPISFFGALIRLFPKRTRRSLLQEANRVCDQPDLITACGKWLKKKKAA